MNCTFTCNANRSFRIQKKIVTKRKVSFPAWQARFYAGARGPGPSSCCSAPPSFFQCSFPMELDCPQSDGEWGPGPVRIFGLKPRLLLGFRWIFFLFQRNLFPPIWQIADPPQLHQSEANSATCKSFSSPGIYMYKHTHTVRQTQQHLVCSTAFLSAAV
jgi:hypothetical protein